MGTFRHSSETGQREYVEDAQPAEQLAPREPEGPPHGWVGDFLKGPTEALPLRATIRSPGVRQRVYRRPTRRRG